MRKRRPGSLRLPEGHHALVERIKVVDYLLNPSHPDNAGKATFFKSLGFTGDDWKELAKSLRSLAISEDCSGPIETSYGTKYIVEGLLASPSKRIAYARTIWLIQYGQRIPRLVTAYPFL